MNIIDLKIDHMTVCSPSLIAHPASYNEHRYRAARMACILTFILKSDEIAGPRV
jgi:hypothetical protein